MLHLSVPRTFALPATSQRYAQQNFAQAAPRRGVEILNMHVHDRSCPSSVIADEVKGSRAQNQKFARINVSTWALDM